MSRPGRRELAGRFRLGLTRTAEQFLDWRLQWLADPGSVRVQPAPDGDGYDVVVRIDGSYRDRAAAESSVARFQAEVHGLAAQLHERAALRQSAKLRAGYGARLCGRPTRSGAPCRMTVRGAMTACAIHRDPID